MIALVRAKNAITEMQGIVLKLMVIATMIIIFTNFIILDGIEYLPTSPLTKCQMSRQTLPQKTHSLLIR